MYGKPDRAENCEAMDSVCRGSGNSHLASHLDVKIVWHQRSINQARKKVYSAARRQRFKQLLVVVLECRSRQRDRPAPHPPDVGILAEKADILLPIAPALSSEKRDSARALSSNS